MNATNRKGLSMRSYKDMILETDEMWCSNCECMQHQGLEDNSHDGYASFSDNGMCCECGEEMTLRMSPDDIAQDMELGYCDAYGNPLQEMKR